MNWKVPVLVLIVVVMVVQFLWSVRSFVVGLFFGCVVFYVLLRVNVFFRERR